MPDLRVTNLAKVLVQYSVNVQPNDRVAIFGGSGYPETGSKNKSAIHWDMSEGGQILVDGELFYESGDFKIYRQAFAFSG
jgi:leucyl aminopeptidase (aminopeptidase T)